MICIFLPRISAKKESVMYSQTKGLPNEEIQAFRKFHKFVQNLNPSFTVKADARTIWWKIFHLVRVEIRRQYVESGVYEGLDLKMHTKNSTRRCLNEPLWKRRFYLSLLQSCDVRVLQHRVDKHRRWETQCGEREERERNTYSNWSFVSRSKVLFKVVRESERHQMIMQMLLCVKRNCFTFLSVSVLFDNYKTVFSVTTVYCYKMQMMFCLPRERYRQRSL